MEQAATKGDIPKTMMDRLSVVIWDSEEPVKNKNKIVVKWNGYDETDGCISIFRYIEANKTALKEKYVNWIMQLGNSRINGITVEEHLRVEKDFSLWWMSLLVEKSIWKSPAIATALKIFALEEIILKYSPASVSLVSGNKKLQKVVKEMCAVLKKNYDYIYATRKNKHHLTLRGIYNNLPLLLKATIYFTTYILSHRPFRKMEKIKWNGGERNNIFFCSYFFNIDTHKAVRGEFLSFYWNQLHEIIREEGYTTNWLHLFVKNERIKTADQAINMVNCLNANSVRQGAHVFHDQYLSFGVMLETISSYLRVYIQKKKLNVKKAFIPTGASFSLWPVLKQDWYESIAGSVAINNLLLYAIFDKAMADMPYQHKGFYLFESQAWERAFIIAWRRHGHGKLFAVPHSTRSFWDLRFQNSIKETTASIPEADFITVNGDASRLIFLSEHFTPERLVPCEALRFGYLTQYKEAIKKNKIEKGRPVRLLVLGDYLGTETIRMLKQLERIVHSMPFPISFAVKPHPNHMLYPGDYPEIQLEVVTGQIGEILASFDIAYASNTTSAAVDAYFAGLKILVSLDADQLNVSPLVGIDDVFFISSDKVLLDALNRLYEQHANSRRTDDFFYLDPAFPQWKKLLRE
jgi:surface carbohydrate biosynthesis protein (TIGR04326 family)